MKTIIRRFRWVALLLPLAAGGAQAAVSGLAFHWAAPADMKWIWSSGSGTTNSDTSSHNAVANLGIVENAISSVAGVNVAIDQENRFVMVKCSQRLTELTTGKTYTSATALGSLTIGTRYIPVGPVTGLPSAPHSYARGIYCSIPGVYLNGASTLLYGVN